MFNRRKFLQFSGLAALAGSVMLRVAPAWAAWPEGAFKAESAADVMRELYGADSFTEEAGIKFKAPEIAENGAVVPVTVEYDGDVKHISVLVEKNPQPLAATFDIPPDALARVSTRIKMGESSRVVALVQTADGKVLGTAREVKVTIGGCGG